VIGPAAAVEERLRTLIWYVSRESVRARPSASIRSERSGDAATTPVTAIVISPVDTEPTLFVADTVNLHGLAAAAAEVGVPLRIPPSLKVNPSGSEPDATLNVMVDG
jgi:hypothetical protein